MNTYLFCKAPQEKYAGKNILVHDPMIISGIETPRILTKFNLSFAQAEWREEVKKHFEKIKSEGTCIHRLDEELIRRRREELRSADLSFSTSSYPKVFRY